MEKRRLSNAVSDHQEWYYKSWSWRNCKYSKPEYTFEKSITLPVHLEQETVWLNRNQMAETKNHSFSDGNKRIAATIFVHFLDKNGVLFSGSGKLIDDHTVVALTIMIAESKPEEKEMMISVIMNYLACQWMYLLGQTHSCILSDVPEGVYGRGIQTAEKAFSKRKRILNEIVLPFWTFARQN